MNREGTVTAGCTRCHGGLSTFEWHSHDKPFGAIYETFEENYGTQRREWRLYRCAGCSRGGLGAVVLSNSDKFPSQYARLERFWFDVLPRVKLPTGTPKEIQREYVEGELCIQAGCFRAAAAMFRSALEKTLTAAGYKVSRQTSLFTQIENAVADAVITEARKQRAHDEIRVLGNDVLHDAWKAVSEEDVVASRDYTQRIIEDFYDNRDAVLKVLRAKNRVPSEDQAAALDSGLTGRKN